jgi:epoxyqueuosine reductase
VDICSYSLRKPEIIAKKLKERAAELGFCALGIAPALLDRDAVQRLASRPRPPFVPWEPELRCRASQWLPGAKSVLAGAVAYGGRYGVKLGRGQGYVSPFALAPDYHSLVGDKLEGLGRYLTELEPRAKFTVQVDSGPGCERLYATAAGVGWQGKNNFIIVPGNGSLVWLGLITTDLELPPDAPLASQCGDCQRCLAACPTKAYTGPNAFEPGQCMAYWAASKGRLTAQQAQLLSGHRIIYGCDYCQLACPHNPPAKGEGNMPDLAEIMTMSAGQFVALFKESAAGWRGRNLLRRNAVLASQGKPEYRPVLETLAQGRGMVAETARWVLEGMPGDE